MTIKEASSKIDSTYSAVTSRPVVAAAPPKVQQEELDRLKADIRNLQEELKTLKSETIEPIERKVEKLSADAEHTNQRIDKFEETFAARFDKLEKLLTSRLPSRPAEPQDEEDDHMESTLANLKRPAPPSSQIQTRRSYLQQATPRTPPRTPTRTTSPTDKGKKHKSSHA
jgi:chromosome segregation ATPase